MHNPCEECIVKVTCSEVCPEKENYTTLLRNALENLRECLSQKMFYRNLQKENQNDIIKIYERKPKIINSSSGYYCIAYDKNFSIWKFIS